MPWWGLVIGAVCLLAIVAIVGWVALMSRFGS
jgi:hypothetical protein